MLVLSSTWNHSNKRTGGVRASRYNKEDAEIAAKHQRIAAAALAVQSELPKSAGRPGRDIGHTAVQYSTRQQLREWEKKNVGSAFARNIKNSCLYTKIGVGHTVPHRTI